MSLAFILLYGAVLVILAFYALVWQQVIKRLPLTFAYANRAITVVWGIVWGYLFFGESVNPVMLVGAVIIICGIVLYATDGSADSEKGGNANE
jgi:drug/metabolite transporter (DMT)-like permease